MNDKLLSQFKSFEWDEGNRDKSWKKHRVSVAESEEIFANIPVAMISSSAHSSPEERYAIFGRTNGGRLLTVIMTPRGEKIRVISARDMSREERLFFINYEKENQKTS